MKPLILTLAILLASSAFAAPNPAPAPAPTQGLKPIRQANAHVTINKMTWSANPDPRLQIDRVCEIDIATPVFDARGSTSYYSELGAGSCQGFVKQTAVAVTVNSGIFLSNDHDPLDHRDRKLFHANLWLSDGAQGGGQLNTPYTGSGVSAWSHDLNTRTLGLDLSPAVNWICVTQGGQTQPFPKEMSMRTSDANEPDCAPTLDEWFIATVEFQD